MESPHGVLVNHCSFMTTRDEDRMAFTPVGKETKLATKED